MSKIAILMAAGMGTRMMPLTKAKPKPLLSVHGVPMIETVIQGLLLHPVKKIYVVTGYLKEHFISIKEKYPQVELIENQEYAQKNNISSLYAARDCLGSDDCFICEADLWVQDPSIFREELMRSCYYGRAFSGYSSDWIFEYSGGRITRIKKGGRDTYEMVGVSYFTRRDAGFIRDAILDTYKQPGHENLFWDEVVDRNLDKLVLDIHPVQKGQITEIDTPEELASANGTFRPYEGGLS